MCSIEVPCKPHLLTILEMLLECPQQDENYWGFFLLGVFSFVLVGLVLVCFFINRGIRTELNTVFLSV